MSKMVSATRTRFSSVAPVISTRPPLPMRVACLVLIRRSSPSMLTLQGDSPVQALCGVVIVRDLRPQIPDQVEVPIATLRHGFYL
jgi:hypothetical protein